ncbi:OmpA family protein [Mariniflexile sp.]|uniref:OmpA family protein n=1 Tax=Mariniflexile sp. TaxID=1979402 RepID=UPI00404873A7
MLHLNTINKLLLVLTLCTLVPVGLFAQSENTTEQATEKSTIVMTESELNSFLSTIAEARRYQLKERENRRRKQDLADLRLKYNQRSEQETRYDNISNEQILRELRYLNQRIDNLSLNNKLPSMGRDNSTIIMPSNPNLAPLYPQNDGNPTMIIPSNNDKIKKLQNQIDSLKNIETNKPIKNSISLTDSLNNVNIKLKGLRQHLDSLESKMMHADKAAAKKKESPEKKSYFKQQVYFGNNSATLNANYFSRIQDLTQILVKYPEAKIMLEGWASPKGNASYNKQLSMRRAEAVEQAFINNGIDPNRIITSFRGEDKTSSDQHARRVDMAIIVR